MTELQKTNNKDEDTNNYFEVCEWVYDEPYEYYETECGESFAILEGTPEDNKMKFCTYCGRKIKVNSK